MHRSIQKIAYLLVAVTALGFPILFVAMWWIARNLELDVPILYLAVGALLLTLLADLFLAIANDRFNERPDAKLHQVNEPTGEEGIIVDGFILRGTTTLGRVRVQGEIWTALCDDGELLKSGQRVKVTSRQGLTLVVKPVV